MEVPGSIWLISPCLRWKWDLVFINWCYINLTEPSGDIRCRSFHLLSGIISIFRLFKAFIFPPLHSLVFLFNQSWIANERINTMAHSCSVYSWHCKPFPKFLSEPLENNALWAEFSLGINPPWMNGTNSPLDSPDIPNSSSSSCFCEILWWES